MSNPSPDQDFTDFIVSDIIPLIDRVNGLCTENSIPFAFSVCSYSDGKIFKAPYSYNVPGNEKTPPLYLALVELINNPELAEDVLWAARRLKLLREMQTRNGPIQ